MRELYARLGVEETATRDQIRRAYRRLAFRLHPDRNPDPEAAAKFASVSEAHEVLTDDEARSAYDEFGFVPQNVGPEKLDAAARQAILASLRNLLDQWFDNDGLDLLATPLMDNMRRTYDEAPGKIEAFMQKLEQNGEKMARLQERLRTRPGTEPYIHAELDKLMLDFKQRRMNLRGELAVVRRARELLDDLTFDQIVREQATMTMQKTTFVWRNP